MNGSDAHLVQSFKKVLGHIYGLFKAVQPIVGGTHSGIADSRKIVKYELEKACNYEDTASLETFPCRLTWKTYIFQPERLAAATMRYASAKRRPNLEMPSAGS